MNGLDVLEQLILGLLSCAQDDMVDLKANTGAVAFDMQPIVVDGDVLHVVQHLDIFLFQLRAMNPPRGLVKTRAQPADAALQQPDFACRRFDPRFA